VHFDSTCGTIESNTCSSLALLSQQQRQARRFRATVIGARPNHGLAVRQIVALDRSLQFMPIADAEHLHPARRIADIARQLTAYRTVAAASAESIW
jgi:hypothetical protein